MSITLGKETIPEVISISPPEIYKRGKCQDVYG
jgi:hypothetical protein